MQENKHSLKYYVTGNALEIRYLKRIWPLVGGTARPENVGL